MKQYKVTITYEVEIVNTDVVTTAHLLSAVQQSHANGCCGTTLMDPPMEFHVDMNDVKVEYLEP